MTPSERENRPGSFVRVDFFSRAATTATTAAFSAFTPFARLLGLFGVRHLSVVGIRAMGHGARARRRRKMRWINLVPLLKFSVWENYLR